MRGKVYKLYASSSSTTNAIASIQLSRKSRLVGCLFAVTLDSVSDNAACYLELSEANTSQYNVNDSMGPIASVFALNNFTTSGQAFGSIAQFVALPGLEYQAGARLYANITITATLTALFNIFIYVQE